MNSEKKISPNILNRIRTLERQCVPRNSHIKDIHNYRKPHIPMVEARGNLRQLAMLKLNIKKGV